MIRTHDLGGGISIDVEITPKFLTAGRASMLIPDPLFEQIKGTLRLNTGTDPTPRVFGQTAMSARAKVKLRGTNVALQVGFKQLATLQFNSCLYAGLKDSDGSIEESSTGLNRTTLIDCATDETMTAPQAPFYLPPNFVRSGMEAPPIDMIDQPSSKARLQRRNAGRDRVNFLFAVRRKTEFIAYLVVVLPNGKHVPLEGFSWSDIQSADINWTAGQPQVVSSQVGVKFDEKLFGKEVGAANLAILADDRLGSNDTLVSRFNKGMSAAQQGQATKDYQVTEFPNYSANVLAQMRDLPSQSFKLS